MRGRLWFLTGTPDVSSCVTHASACVPNKQGLSKRGFTYQGPEPWLPPNVRWTARAQVPPGLTAAFVLLACLR